MATSIAGVTWTLLDGRFDIDDPSGLPGVAATARVRTPDSAVLTVAVCTWPDGKRDVRTWHIRTKHKAYERLVSELFMPIESLPDGFSAIALTTPATSGGSALAARDAERDLLDRLAEGDFDSALRACGVEEVCGIEEQESMVLGRAQGLISVFPAEDLNAIIATYILCRVIPFSRYARTSEPWPVLHKVPEAEVLQSAGREPTHQVARRKLPPVKRLSSGPEGRDVGRHTSKAIVPDESLRGIRSREISAEDPFRFSGVPTDFTLTNFWSWQGSDLLDNTMRGALAEFIVARAVGDRSRARSSWAAWDLTTPEGIKIEVKSAAFVQSWAQRKPSTIVFAVPKRRGWDSEGSRYDEEPRRHADVYVFALLAEQDSAVVDPMNLDHWRFYVLPTRILDERERSQHSITLSSLEKLTDALTFIELAGAVKDPQAHLRATQD